MKYESSSARPRRLFQNGKSIPTPRAVSASVANTGLTGYGNCPGCGDTLPVLEESARSRRRGLVFHSSSFFTHSCALFAHYKVQLFSFQAIAHSLSKNTRGGGLLSSHPHLVFWKAKNDL